MSILRKVAALLLVPVIAVLSANLLSFLQHYLISSLKILALHDDYYVAPNTEVYLILLYAFGFVPALFLRNFTGTLLAAVTPAVAISIYQLLHIYLEGFLSIVAVSSILSFYLLTWFIALITGLNTWGTREQESKA